MSTKKQAVLGVVIVAVVLTLFVSGRSIAGSLEPSAAPAPTMKTLDQIPPTWSQTLPADQRFQLVLNDAAVLDKETGLVWEKSPSTTTADWVDARYTCQTKSVGNRKGWRLPAVEELASLVDPSKTNPALPAGHPFTNVQSSLYWSATTPSLNATGAWGVYFSDSHLTSYMITAFANVWCVRGGQGYGGQ